MINSLARGLEVLVNDIGSPNLGFSIYDSHRINMYGFTRNQLEILANLIWLTNNLLQNL